jgi:hypothetical protein
MRPEPSLTTTTTRKWLLTRCKPAMVSPSGLAPEWPQRVELQLEICARRVRDTLRVLIYGAEKMGSVSPRRASRRPQTYLDGERFVTEQATYTLLIGRTP